MKRQIFCLVGLLATLSSAAAFDAGWVLNARANVGGSLTVPSISQSDLDKLGANKMEGMNGFLGGGLAEVGHIWDTAQCFKLPEDHAFSGIGAFGRIGVTQGYAGQISGASVAGEQIDIFVHVHYMPVITLGAAGKAYFLDNRLAVGLAAGMKIIADTTPTYELYSSEPSAIESEVGTIIVNDFMMKNMNPVMGSFELFVEYNIPILDTMELILGGFGQFNIFKPKYLTMPNSVMDKLLEDQKAQVEANTRERVFNPESPMKSYWINSFDYGLTLALGFRL